jgi:hypothetical protein
VELTFAGGPTISVEGSNAGNLTWLREYFGSALTSASGHPASARLVILPSSEELERLRSTRPLSARPVPVFAVEREMLEADGWEHDRSLVIDYASHGYVLVLDHGCTTVVLEPDVMRPRFIVALILYELVALEMRRTWLELHASSIVIDGCAHLVIGPKGAGKTTLALALGRAGGGLLGNDRAFVRPDGVVGMPTPVKLMPDTVARFSELASPPAPADAFMFTTNELAGMTSAPAEDEPIMLPPAEVARRLGTPPAAGVHPPGTLVFPEVVHGFDGIDSVPLPPDEVEHLLLANLYRAASAAREPTVFERLGGGRPPVPAELAGQLARERPAHRVRLGAKALSDPALIRAVVDGAGCR